MRLLLWMGIAAGAMVFLHNIRHMHQTVRSDNTNTPKLGAIDQKSTSHDDIMEAIRLLRFDIQSLSPRAMSMPNAVRAANNTPPTAKEPCIQRPSAAAERRRKVVLAFPFSHELALLRLRLESLKDHIDLFVVGESCWSTAGHSKTMFFKEAEHLFSHLPVHHVEDCANRTIIEGKKKKGGWHLERRLKELLGETISDPDSFGLDFDEDTIIIMGDADETPSVEAVAWLRRQPQRSQYTVYTFEKYTLAFENSFDWLLPQKTGYSTMTARTLRDERRFWIDPSSRSTQTVLHVPIDPSGWHCSSCMPPHELLMKYEHANQEDGAIWPEITAKNVTVEMIETLIACGRRVVKGEQLLAANKTLNAEERSAIPTWTPDNPKKKKKKACEAFQHPFTGVMILPPK